MVRRSLVGSAAVIATWLMMGCSDSTPSSESVSDPVVLTLQANQTDFGKYQTFFLKPQVSELNEDGTVGVLDQTTAQPLLDATQKNMVARGYKAVDRQADADLAVEMLHTTNISSSVTCYSWWDPFYWGYPAYGYYPYYGSCDSTVWKSGLLATVLVDLTPAKSGPSLTPGQVLGDAAAPPPSNRLGGVWFSGIYGVDLTSIEARTGIDQAFAQSPYLTSSAGR
jgi:hypothetical protein